MATWQMLFSVGALSIAPGTPTTPISTTRRITLDQE
jgi:hypothetical protein